MNTGAESLDALLQAWRARVLPDAFADLDAWIEPAPVLNPAFWRIMRPIWRGTAWRRFAAPAGVPGALAAALRPYPR